MRIVLNWNGCNYITLNIFNNTNFKIFENSKNQLWFTGFDASLSLFREGAFRANSLGDSLKEMLRGAHFFHEPLENEEGQLLFFKRGSELWDSPFFLVDTNQQIESFSFTTFQIKIHYPDC